MKGSEVDFRFLSNHPDTFRICSRVYLETFARFSLIKDSKPKLFDFENLGSEKNHQKTRFKIFKIE